MQKEVFTRLSIFDFMNKESDTSTSVVLNSVKEEELFTEHLPGQPWEKLTKAYMNDLATPSSVNHITNYLYEDLLLRGHEFEHDYEFTGIELNQRTSYSMGGYVMFKLKERTCRLVMNKNLKFNKDVVKIALHELAHLFLPPGHNHDKVWKDKADLFGEIYSVKGVSDRTTELNLTIKRKSFEVTFKMTEYGASIQSKSAFKDSQTIHTNKLRTRASVNKYLKYEKNNLIEIISIVEK